MSDLGGTPGVCGILPRRAAGAKWKSDAFAMNSLLAEHCRRNGWLFIDNWTQFDGKNHLYAKDGVHFSPWGVGGLSWRLESEMRTRVYFLETMKV